MSVTIPAWMLWLIPLAVGAWMGAEKPRSSAYSWFSVPTERSCFGCLLALVTLVAWVAFAIGHRLAR